MPSYIIHLACAKKLLCNNKITNKEKKMEFYIGSILPDTMPVGMKRESHFWNDETFKMLKRAPDLDMFEKEYTRNLANPVVAAYYIHLRMDKEFVDGYWTRHFKLMNDDLEEVEGFGDVTKISVDGKLYDRQEMLSNKFYYGDYDRMRPYVIEKYGLNDILEEYFEKNLHEITKEEITNMLKKYETQVISEVSYEAGIDAMASMLYSIVECESTAPASQPEKPDLTVFDMAELEDLIEEISRKCDILVSKL